MKIVHLQLRNNLYCLLVPMGRFSYYPPHDKDRNEFTECAHRATEELLSHWRWKKEKCVYNERYMCPPCIAGDKEQCISLSVTGKLFNQMTDGQIGKISRLFALVFSDSVCTKTKSDLGEELWALTPPCEALGLCDSLVDFSFVRQPR